MNPFLLLEASKAENKIFFLRMRRRDAMETSRVLRILLNTNDRALLEYAVEYFRKNAPS